MRPFFAPFSEPVWSGHAPSWADFITTTPKLKFSVNTVIGYVFGRRGTITVGVNVKTCSPF